MPVIVVLLLMLKTPEKMTKNADAGKNGFPISALRMNWIWKTSTSIYYRASKLLLTVLHARYILIKKDEVDFEMWDERLHALATWKRF